MPSVRYRTERSSSTSTIWKGTLSKTSISSAMYFREELTTCATGWTLTCGDREGIKPIVIENVESGGEFRDLLVEWIQDKVFRVK